MKDWHVAQVSSIPSTYADAGWATVAARIQSFAGFATELNASLPKKPLLRTAWEWQRLCLTIAVVVLVVAIVVALLVISRSTSEDSEAGDIDDEEAAVDTHTSSLRLRASSACATAAELAREPSEEPRRQQQETRSGAEGTGVSEDEAAGEKPVAPTKSKLRWASAIQKVSKELKVINHFKVKQEEGNAFCELDSEKLIQEGGISALCTVDPNNMCGVSGVPVWVVLVSLALVAWCLQFVALYWLFASLQPRNLLLGHASVPLPSGFKFCAVYLHFMSCVADVPLDVYLFFWLRQRKEPRLWLNVTVFLMDAFVIPLLNFVVGALYLINSERADVLVLNACALTFIKQMDNMVLKLSAKMELLVQRHDYNSKIKVKINRRAIQKLNWWMCQIPLIPLGITTATVALAHALNL